MKHFILTALFLSLEFCGYAQAYQSIKVSSPEYNTHNSSSGIEVRSITYQSDGSYRVILYNTNHNDPYYYTSYDFEWYLSYKGKRVSDYFQSTIRCRKNVDKYVYAWPNEVPQGYERYVSVQFGREQNMGNKDRRDDD